MIINGLIVSLPGLERSLQGYLQSGTEEPFNMKTVPVMAVKEEPEKKVAAKKKEPNKQEQIQSPVLFLFICNFRVRVRLPVNYRGRL